MPLPEVQDWSRRHALEARTAATARALSARPRIHFEAGHPWDGDRPLPGGAPHLQVQPGLDDAPAYRALADALALRLLLSDDQLHQDTVPQTDPVATLVFDWLEQWRSESLAPARWPGMRGNLQRRFDQWCFLFEGAGLLETRTGQHLLCFALMAHSRLFGVPIPERLEDLTESARHRMSGLLAAPLAQLGRCRTDQQAFGQLARTLALNVAHWFDDLIRQERQRAPRRHLDFSVALLDSEASDEAAGAAVAGGAPAAIQGAASYAIWSRRHDRVDEAASLVRPALLLEYRRRLDVQLAHQVWSLTRLVQALWRALARPQPRGRLFAQEEGHIDGRRLAQLVSSPHNHRVFYQQREEPTPQASITLLLDCSGSMRHHGMVLALLMDILGRVFERAGIPHEFLGFTTATWNGGLPAREWAAAGRRPSPPGRLNATQHLIFRSLAMTRQQSRLGLTTALRPELFREGVDGEAVQWACERLQAQTDARRKILWVVSDGGPMDSATALANPPGFLDAHLRRVVQHQMRDGGVEILGIGVGQDLSAYYPHSIGLDLDKGLSMTALLALIRTLDAARPGQP